MSAAHWRKADELHRAQPQLAGGAGDGRASAGDAATIAIGRQPPAGLAPYRLRHVLVLAAVLVFPWVVPPFFTFQIGAQALALGLIALSLTFLAATAACCRWRR